MKSECCITCMICFFIGYFVHHLVRNCGAEHYTVRASEDTTLDDSMLVDDADRNEIPKPVHYNDIPTPMYNVPQRQNFNKIKPAFDTTLSDGVLVDDSDRNEGPAPVNY